MQTTLVDGRVHRLSVSVIFGTSVFLQPSVELEVAHCSKFLLRRSRAEPESAQLRRVRSMDRTICPSRRVVDAVQGCSCVEQCSGRSSKFTFRDGLVYFTGLQQITFNANRANLERMIRDQGRSTQVSSSSQNLASILDRYVPEWMGEDAVDGFCFHSPRVQSHVCFALPMKLESRGRVGRFSRSAKVQKLPASRSSSELSAHQMAPSGVIAH